MTNDSKSNCILTFDGDVNKYKKQFKQFMALGNLKGFGEILTRTVKAPADTDTLDPNDPNDRPRIVARKANNQAYSKLLLSCLDDVSFHVVQILQQKQGQWSADIK